MKWSELSIHTTEEAVEPIANILHEAGASGVVIEDPSDLVKVWDTTYGEVYDLNPEDYPKEGVIIKAYLPVNSALSDTIETIKDAIQNLIQYEFDLGPNTFTLTEVKEEQWATAWKDYYHPVTISERITIVPTWENYERKNQDEITVRLDPGMAFGTGTHPTTVMCIQALEKVVSKDALVMDVGCGSGILSIVAAKLGAKKVLAFDLDEVAVHSAQKNIELNEVGNIVKIKQNNLLENVSEKADLIVANLLAEIILRFAEDAFQKVKSGGLLITSGIIKDKQKRVSEKLISVGFAIVDVLQMEEWVAIIARKPKEHL